MKAFLIISVTLMALAGGAGSARASVLDELLQEYRQQGAAEFDAASGEALWKTTFLHRETGQVRSCTTCHRADPRSAGEHVKTGKPIDPMAPSVNSKRLTDARVIEKWFTRNCKWSLGRECTPAEKGNVLLFLRGQ